MCLSKKRVERTTVAILKLELAQSGDGQAWGMPRRSVARWWRKFRQSSDRRRRSWYPINRMTVVKWLSSCEDDRQATVVTLHDTGPWGRYVRRFVARLLSHPTVGTRAVTVVFRRVTDSRVTCGLTWVPPSVDLLGTRSFWGGGWWWGVVNIRSYQKCLSPCRHSSFETK